MMIFKKRITGSRIRKLKKCFAKAVAKQQYKIATRVTVLAALSYSNVYHELKYANLIYSFILRKKNEGDIIEQSRL